MAKDYGPSIKDDEQYKRLREEGASKEKATRIANTGRQAADEHGGKTPKYEEQPKEDLEERTRELGIEGRSEMNKDELIDALRNH
jgi:hypothetical protein